MADAKKDVYVRVKDRAGNEFFCPIEALIDPEEATEEQLENCVDDGTVSRYAGDIEVVEAHSRSVKNSGKR